MVNRCRRSIREVVRPGRFGLRAVRLGRGTEIYLTARSSLQMDELSFGRRVVFVVVRLCLASRVVL